MSYGSNKSNFLLLSCYGFCVPGNLADRLALGQPGIWGDHNDIVQDLEYVDQAIKKALSHLNPKFLHFFSGVPLSRHVHVAYVHGHPVPGTWMCPDLPIWMQNLINY